MAGHDLNHLQQLETIAEDLLGRNQEVGVGVETLRPLTRMDAIQAPIIPVIGEMIRQTPGTISLGQGVVHYGPPQAAIDAARAALDDPATHEYQDGAGMPLLVGRLTSKLASENGIDLRRGGGRLMVTAGANMAFMHAVFAVTEPGDEVILPVPFYFNHEMAIQMAGCRVVPVPTDERYQLRVDAVRRAITGRTRAVVTISPNNPSGAVFSEPSLRELNTLCRDRGLYHISDEVYEYFTYGPATHVSPGSFPDAVPAHDFDVFAVEGVRVRRVAHRLHGVPGASRLGDDEEPGHDSGVPAGHLADRRCRRARSRPAYCEPHVRELAHIRQLVLDAFTHLGTHCDTPPADGAFYCLLKVNTDMTRSRSPSASFASTASPSFPAPRSA